MSQIATGDHWSYDLIDEISGEVKRKPTFIITEVTPNNITARTELPGSTNFGIVVYDLSWNMLKSGPQRFSPNDGSGIQTPLEVNKSWPVRSNRIDSTGQIWKKTGESRVTGKETVTTKAGQFDTFVIETQASAHNNNDYARKTDITVKSWYSPVINHWVKRSSVFRVNGHVLQSETLVLTGYGRKKT